MSTSYHDIQTTYVTRFTRNVLNIEAVDIVVCKETNYSRTNMSHKACMSILDSSRVKYIIVTDTW